jgi:hypothetical protein
VAAPSSDKATQIQGFWQDFLESLVPLDGQLLGSVPPSMRRSARWLAIGAGTTCLLAWNGRLVLSTGAGVGMIFLAHNLRETGWRSALVEWRNRLEALNQRLVLSVCSGVGATFGTYVILSIWLETQNHWLATGMILQGTATMGTLGLLLWQNWDKRQAASLENIQDWNHCLLELTHDDPLKRLMAIHQINQQLPDRLDQQGHAAEYFRIMLSRETDEIIRSALLDGLQIISQQQPLKHFAKQSPRSNPRDGYADRSSIELPQTVLPKAVLPNAVEPNAVEPVFCTATAPVFLPMEDRLPVAPPLENWGVAYRETLLEQEFHPLSGPRSARVMGSGENFERN